MSKSLAIVDDKDIMALATVSEKAKQAQIILGVGNKLSMQVVVELSMQVKDRVAEKQVPNIGMILAQQDGIDNINKIVAVIMKRFMVLNFQNSEESISEMIYIFVNDLLQFRRDFTLFDVVFFFRWIKDNWGRDERFIVYGNILNELKFFELFRTYIAERAEEMVALKRLKSQEPVLQAEPEKFAVISGGKYIQFLNREDGVMLRDCDKYEDAAQMEWATAYQINNYLLSRGEKSKIVNGPKKKTITQYINENMPGLREPVKRKLDKLQFSAERTMKLMQFIKLSKELEEKDKEQIGQNILKTAKEFEQRLIDAQPKYKPKP